VPEGHKGHVSTFDKRNSEDEGWAYEVSLYVHLNPVCTAAFALGKRAKQMEALGVGVASPEEVS